MVQLFQPLHQGKTLIHREAYAIDVMTVRTKGQIRGAEDCSHVNTGVATNHSLSPSIPPLTIATHFTKPSLLSKEENSDKTTTNEDIVALAALKECGVFALYDWNNFQLLHDWFTNARLMDALGGMMLEVNRLVGRTEGSVEEELWSVSALLGHLLHRRRRDVVEGFPSLS